MLNKLVLQDDLLNEHTRGELDVYLDTHNDILTMVLRTPKYKGRVRASVIM